MRMTVAMARLFIRTTINRIGRFDPEQAHDLTEAISVLIEDAIEHAPARPADAKGDTDDAVL